MEILLTAKKWLSKILSSSAGCWGPCSQSNYREEPLAPSLNLRKKAQTAARWNIGLGSGQGSFLWRRVKVQNPTIPPLKAPNSNIPEGKLEGLCLGAGF